MGSKQNVSILIIDTPGVARMLLCHYLEESGYSTVAVDDCKAALDALRNGDYRLIVLDTFADSAEGLNFIRTVRKRFTRSELPILLITSMDSEEIEAPAFVAGANDFIAKPIHPQQLQARVEVHLDLQKEHTDLSADLDFYGHSLDGADEGVWHWNFQEDTIRYSPRFVALLEPESLRSIGTSAQEWLSRIHPDDAERVAEELKQHLEGLSSHFVSQHRLVSSENTTRWVMIKGQASFDENNRPLSLDGTIADISSSLTFDSVTGLSNVHIFCEWLRHISAAQQRSKNNPFALLAISLSNYAELRRSLDTSDLNLLLATIAKRIHLGVRATDLISRLDISCFGTLLTQARNISVVLKVVGRLQASLEAPITVSGVSHKIEVGVGVAFSSTHYDRPEDMIAAATEAATQALSESAGRIKIADPALAKMTEQRLAQEAQLSAALEGNKLALSFSPIVNANTQEPIAYQSVLNESEGAKLIKVGDYQQWGASSLVQAVDDWSLEATLSEVLLWARAESMRDMFICLPVQVQQLTEGRLFQYVEKEMPERYRPFLEKLCLEVNEEALLQQSEKLAYVGRKLNEHGIGLGVSKFGLNLTSLKFLTSLPVKYLKLSPNFTDVANKHANLLRLLQAMSKEIGIPLIATGVNTASQATLALERGLPFQQGRLYSEVEEVPLG